MKRRVFLPPDELVHALRRKALAYADLMGNRVPSVAQRGLCVGLLDAAINDKAGATQKRHMITEHVWGIVSSKDLSACHVNALLAYLTQDGAGDFVQKELAALVEQIQTELHGGRLLPDEAEAEFQCEFALGEIVAEQANK